MLASGTLPGNEAPMKNGRLRGVVGWGGSIAVVALLALAAVAAMGASPLTIADVVRFLHAGISEQTILLEIDSRGVGEPLNDAGEASLRAAGATETLVVAVRRAAPTPKAPPPVAPESVSAPALPSRAPGAPLPTFATDTRSVRVPVCVLDRAGHPVLDLDRDAFRVADDGKRQPITLFSRERRPLRIALALDLSRSMDNKIRQVEEALRHFIDLLEPADQILVLTFNDRVRVVQDFTSDRSLLERVLDELEPSGGTALYDAAFEAIQRVKDAPAESKAVVLVTDGVDTESSISFKDLRETARRAEVPVFSIGLDAERPERFAIGPGPGGRGGHGGRGGWPGGGGGGWGGGGLGGGRARPHTAAFDAKPLSDLADDTGAIAEIVKGLEHYTPGSDEPPGSEKLKTAVESIASILRHRYLLGYDPPTAHPHEWRTIHVEVDRPDTTARARKGYYGGD
jgi:VWFA-related protein